MIRFSMAFDNDASYAQVPGTGMTHSVLLGYQNCKTKNVRLTPNAVSYDSADTAAIWATSGV